MMPESSKPPAGRWVKGSALVDYVMLMRANPDLAWAENLLAEDLAQLKQMILPASWYPADLFQRLGVAVFKLVSKESYEVVRGFGRFLADRMNKENPGLVVPGRAQDTLSKYRVIQERLYSFKIIEIVESGPGRSRLRISTEPGDVAARLLAEVTAATAGRLVELSGGRNLEMKLLKAVWEGAKQTTLVASWEARVKSEG
ncbi:MAG: hypothetical protein A2V67_06605 [Deltaproteobacteria bacterium RBG_13_61_14]|nr:MAG: hypothetical protein A2V67_06605 [Deltaproteobacteria bacterium RBG_13_61_14]